MHFPGGSAGKESACNTEDLDMIPRLGRSPGGRHGNPLQYSCLENPHGQRSLVVYSPCGCKEPDNQHRLKYTCGCSVTKSCPTNGDPMDCSQTGSSGHEISQARMLEWVVISVSRATTQPRDRTWVSCLAAGFFTN